MNKKMSIQGAPPNLQRETFSTGLTVFFATLGSAVGLGNIWKFPYLAGTNGGGAFLLVYILCTLLVGIPVMVCEFYLGRKTRSNPVGAFVKLKAHPFWKVIGYMGVLSAFLIMFFYSSVAGWVYSYFFKGLFGGLRDVTPALAGETFGNTVLGPLSPIIWQGIVLVVVSGIIIMGVRNGIEKVTKTLMPLLFLLIIICDIRSLTLPGAREGLNFLFSIDFTKLANPEIILTALGLAFFKLSLGMGTMLTYSSYFTQDNNMIKTSARVAISDLMVSLLAGLAIFPAVFSFGMEPEMGPSLLFVTIPLVFSQIPFGGNILLVLFFLLTMMAATTAMLSLVEVPVAFFTEELKLTRKKAVIITSTIIFAIGITATLSADSGSALGNISIFGKSLFDLYDFISSNILLPLGGLLIVLFTGWFAKKEGLMEELSNNHSLKNHKILNIYYVVMKYVTPILVFVIFMNSLGILRFITNFMKSLIQMF